MVRTGWLVSAAPPETKGGFPTWMVTVSVKVIGVLEESVTLTCAT
jgi:hypothetical protein